MNKRAYVVTTRTGHVFVIIKTIGDTRELYRVLHIMFKEEFHKKLSSRAIRRLRYEITLYAPLMVDCEESLDYVISEVNRQSGMYNYHFSSGIIQSYTVEI